MYPKINLDILETDGIDIGIKPSQKNFLVKKEINYSKSKRPKSHPHKTFSSHSHQSKILRDCTTIVSYRGPNGKTSKADAKGLHLKNLEYIQKEGKGWDGKKPELYGSDNEQDYIKNMDELSWRIILSPESNDVDLKIMTKQFIKKLEDMTGYKLTWVAANHYNTLHNHCHILINGKDKNGRIVKFTTRELIKEVMRENARECVTNQLGYKTEFDINEGYEKMCEKLYFTKLDRMIKEKLDDKNIMDLNFTKKDKTPYIINRIDFLLKNKFCTFDKKKGNLIFKQGWDEELKKIGKYNTYLDGYNYAHCTPDNYSLHLPSKDGNVEGILLKKYIMQDNSNNFAIVLKKADNKVVYVPLNFYPENCKIGDRLEVKIKDKFVNVINKK